MNAGDSFQGCSHHHKAKHHHHKKHHGAKAPDQANPLQNIKQTFQGVIDQLKKLMPQRPATETPTPVAPTPPAAPSSPPASSYTPPMRSAPV